MQPNSKTKLYTLLKVIKGIFVNTVVLIGSQRISPGVVATLLVSCLFFSAAKADLILGLSFEGSTDQEEEVFSGDTLLVNMFLADTDEGATLGGEGLIEGGGQITQSSTGSAQATLSAVPNFGVNTGSHWFGPSLTSPVLGLAPANVASAFGRSTPFFTVGQGLTSIHLFQFQFTITGGLNDTVTLTPDILGNDLGNLSGTGRELDPFTSSGSFQSVQATITAVPEASAVVMAPFLLALFQICYRNRPGPKCLGNSKANLQPVRIKSS